MFREQLVLRALCALCEIADECGTNPAPRSLSLRFILAYTFVVAGAEPKSKWIWDSFWAHATAAADSKRPLDAYIRGTGARGAFVGICREIGFPADHEFLQALRAQARRHAPAGVERKASSRAANDEARDDDSA